MRPLFTRAGASVREPVSHNSDRDKCVSLGTIITFFGAESGVPESGTCTVRCYDACRRFHPRRPGSICLGAAGFFCIQHAPLTNAFGFNAVQGGKLVMLSKRVNLAIFAAVLAGIFSVSRFTPTLRAQQTAVEALEKAKVLRRMPEYKAAKGTSPGFVLDPAWPQPLPHHWVIGDIGGI